MSANYQSVGAHFGKRGLVERHCIAVATDVEVVPILSVLVYKASPFAVLNRALGVGFRVGDFHNELTSNRGFGQNVFRCLRSELYVAAPVGRHVFIWTAIKHNGHRGGVGIGRGNIPMPAYCDHSASIVPGLYGRDVGIINPSAGAGRLQMDVVVAVDGRIFACERVHLVGYFGVPSHVGHCSRKSFLSIIGHQLLVQCLCFGRCLVIYKRSCDLLRLRFEGGFYLWGGHVIGTADHAFGDKQLVTLAPSDVGHQQKLVRRADNVSTNHGLAVECDALVLRRCKENVLVVGNDDGVEACFDVLLRTNTNERRRIYGLYVVFNSIVAGRCRQRQSRENG